MELIIGRDHATNRLRVIKGNQYKVFSRMPEMQKDISEKHCRITQINDDKFAVTAIKGVTTVNGLEVRSKEIKLTDEIKLGKSGFVLPLNQVLKSFKSDVSVDPVVLVTTDKKKSGSTLNTTILRLIATAMTILATILSRIMDPTHPAVLITGVLTFFTVIYAIYDAIKNKREQ